MRMEPVLSRDPRTGEVRARVGVEADTAAVDAAVRGAHATLDALADRANRSALLRAAADGVESRADELIAAADAETALGVPRLTGELARVAYQFRFFADIVDDGAFLGVVIDPPDPSAVPPRPELRRWKVPIGTVAVFAASNFPFAFSVPGGDTASALAAGYPAGVDLVRHPLIAAVGFTGSIPGGRALFDLAAARAASAPFLRQARHPHPRAHHRGGRGTPPRRDRRRPR